MFSGEQVIVGRMPAESSVSREQPFPLRNHPLRETTGRDEQIIPGEFSFDMKPVIAGSVVLLDFQ